MICNESLLDRLIEAHISHILDSHYKVANACIHSFCLIAPFCIEGILINLENILEKLFVNITEGKEVTRELCKKFLIIISESIESIFIMSFLLNER